MKLYEFDLDRNRAAEKKIEACGYLSADTIAAMAKETPKHGFIIAHNLYHARMLHQQWRERRLSRVRLKWEGVSIWALADKDTNQAREYKPGRK